MADSHSRPVAIYVLRDADGVERYIGKSVIPATRFAQHRRDRGWCATYEVLEWSGVGKWIERERYWIAFGKLLGWPLENLTSGGDGTRGVKLHDEHKRRIAAKLKGNKNGAGKTISLEHKRRISEAQKASWKTEWRKAHHPRGMRGKAGWNRGLTKETDPRIAAAAGKSSESHQGHIPWNKGLTKSDPRIAACALKLKTSSSFRGKNPWVYRRAKH